ncbi:Calx-beta domain-containing protein [Grimontia marina]|uniref:Serralysin n=1 Tax=Grimontia marina TaxID=646534 RepID=A0A128FAB1_9GAMM|nr:Calx-beta domain-containing protein [Grimontia marina]CZF83709.1 Serralysin [Grimontia marina]
MRLVFRGSQINFSQNWHHSVVGIQNVESLFNVALNAHPQSSLNITLSPTDHISFFGTQLAPHGYSQTRKSRVYQNNNLKHSVDVFQAKVQNPASFNQTINCTHQHYSLTFLLTSTWFGQALESDFPNLFSGGSGGNGGSNSNFSLFPENHNNQSSSNNPPESGIPLDLLILDTDKIEALTDETLDVEANEFAENSPHSSEQSAASKAHTPNEQDAEQPQIAANHRRHDYAEENYHLHKGGSPPVQTVDPAMTASHSVEVVSVSTTPGVEENAGESFCRFNVTLSEAPVETATFSYSLTSLTATVGEDFSSILFATNGVSVGSGQLVVPPGISTFVVMVSIKEDTVFENSENFNFTVGGKSAMGTIQDNDPHPEIIEISLNTEDVLESDSVGFDVKMSQASVVETSFSFDFLEGSAVKGTDFSSIASFSDGVSFDSTTKEITVSPHIDRFSFTVDTYQDSVDEPNESIIVSVGGKQAVANIIDDDAAPEVEEIQDAVNAFGSTIYESQSAIFTVNLTNPASQTTQYHLSLSNLTATSVEDYSFDWSFTEGVTFDATTGLLSVPAYVASFQMLVPTIGDLIDEPDETFRMDIDNESATATIVDDDPLPAITFVSNGLNPFGQQIDEGDPAHFTVSLTNPSSSQLSYNLNLSDITAVASADYSTLLSFTDGVTYDGLLDLLYVPAGISTFSVSLSTIQDPYGEVDESFSLTVGGKTGTAVILDDDPHSPVITVSDALDFSGNPVDEADVAIFTVSLSSPLGYSAEYSVSLTDGTATVSSDYSNAMVFSGNVAYDSGTGKVTVPAGETIFTVSVPTNTDTTDENNETFTLRVGGDSGIATIIDDDPAPTITSVSNAVDSGGNVVDEAEGAVFTVSLSNPSAFSVDFSLVLANGTATLTSDYTNAITFSDGVTYNSGTGLVSVPAGVTSFTVTVPTVTDNIDESNETFTLTVGGQSGTATIIDDDPAPTITSVSNAVDSGGNAVDEAENAVFTVSLSNPSAFSVNFLLALTNGTATLTDDYTSTMVFSDGVTYNGGTGLVTVPAGVTSFTVTVPTVSDTIDEADETFTLTIGGQTGTASILDDDITTPIVSLTDDANDNSIILAAEGAATSTNIEVTINHDKFVAGGSVVIDVINDTNLSTVELIYAGGTLEFAGGGAASGYSYNSSTGVISWNEPTTPDGKTLDVSAYQIDVRANTSSTGNDGALMDDLPTASSGNLLESADSALISFAFSESISDAVDDASLVDTKETDVTVSALPARDTLVFVDDNGEFQFVEAGDTFTSDTEMRVLQSHQHFGENSIYTDVSMAGTNSVSEGDVTIRAVTYTGDSPDQASVLTSQLLAYGNSSPLYSFDGLGVDSGSGTAEVDSLYKESLVIDFGTKTMRDVQIDLQSVLYAPTGSAGAITHAIVLNNNVQLADYSYTDIMNNTDGRAIISIEESGGFDEIRLYVVSIDPLVNRNFTVSAIRATEYTSPQNIDFYATDSSGQTSSTEALTIDYNSEGLDATGNLARDSFRVVGGENATNPDQMSVTFREDYWGKITGSDGTPEYTDSGISYSSTSAQAVHGYGGDDRIETAAGDDLIFTGATGGTLGTDDELEMLPIDIRNSEFATRPLGNDASSLTNLNGILVVDVISGLTVDIANGGSGNDIIHGGEGTDFLYGHTDNDWLFGYNHNDLIRGGEGNDRIYGGLGHDVMLGDGGDDIFYWMQEDIDASIFEQDEVTGFVEGEDMIDLSDLLSSGSNTLDLLWITENAGGTSIIHIDTDQDGLSDQDIYIRFFDLDNWSSGGTFKSGIFTPETEALLFTGAETITITATQITIDVPDTIVI